MDSQQFKQPEMQHAFVDNDQARAEIGADHWFVIVYDIGPIAIVVTETGGLWELKLTGFNYHLQLADEFEILFSARVEVLHAIQEHQRARVYGLKRANTKLRKSLNAQLRALRSARQRYDALVSSAIVR
jgi:hypothetical protein